MDVLGSHMKESNGMVLQESTGKRQKERSVFKEGSYPLFPYQRGGMKSLKFYPRGQDTPPISPPDEPVRR
jgi:hypothetical protein